MNRAARRAARHTKRGRDAHAAATEHICEHGNWTKTDRNGNPMCPHGCGFPTAQRRIRAAMSYYAHPTQALRNHDPDALTAAPTPGDPYPTPTAPPVA